MYNPYDYYFNQAKKKGYKARSVFKLEEIDNKFGLIDSSIKNVLDIGCAPGSWSQYISKKISDNSRNSKLLGFDLKKVNLNFENSFFYEVDVRDTEKIQEILDEQSIKQFDLIVSDMAPNTIGMKDIDSIRSIGLIEKSLWIYDKYLTENGKFVIKVFMGPGYDEFLNDFKAKYGAKNIRTYRPKAIRKESKETYIIKN